MRVLVVGAGATGGYFGGRLAQHGVQTHFLVRPARAQRLAETGLVLRSPLGNATICDCFITGPDLTSIYGVILLACKAFDLPAVIADIAPAVGPDTLLLPLLNGLGHLDRLDAAFGARRVLGAVCYISSVIAADGGVDHLNNAQDLIVGARHSDTEGLDAAFATLALGRFRVRRAPAVMQDMWEKFVFITTVAAVTTLARGSIGTLLATRSGLAVAMGLFDECAAVAAAFGHALRPKAVETTRRTITEAGSAFTASMLRDLLAGQALEAEPIIGDMITRAEQAALPTPYLRSAFLPLETYEAARKHILFAPQANYTPAH